MPRRSQLLVAAVFLLAPGASVAHALRDAPPLERHDAPPLERHDAPPPERHDAPPPERHDAPPLERIVRVVDLESRADLPLDALTERLARHDVVFLGETHLDETTHRLELELLRRLVEARDGHVTLSLEMLSREAQGDLDAWLATEIDDGELARRVRLWANHETAYAPLLELARAEGLPVVAANAPRSVIRALAFGGGTLEDLDPELRELAPERLHPSSDAYWARVDNATRGHRGMVAATTPEQRLTSTQSLWDNTMGESIARALSRRPDHLVFHVAGAFHSAWKDGTVAQLAARAPGASFATIDVRPTRDPDAVDASSAPRSADFLALVGAVASEPQDGRWSVAVDRDARYALHVPERAADDARVPLLVWLPDDGVPVDASVSLWRTRLGERAAIAVVEPIHRERQADLSLAGRWIWPDRARHDIGDAVEAVTATWAHVLRHQPVDPGRVLIAGEGAGGTVAAAAGALSTGWSGEALGVAPSGTALLRELPLVRPEERTGPSTTRLTVLTPPEEREAWTEEAAEHAAVGQETRVVEWPRDPWRREAALTAAVRSALGLDAAKPTTRRAHVVLPADTPLARTWARTLAAGERDAAVAVLSGAEAAALGEGLAGSREIPLEIEPEALLDATRIPRAPGPFGGTTVLVVPPGREDELERWVRLEKDGVLSTASRFHRLRVATLGERRPLGEVLSTLKAEGRRNVLILPATFVASPDLMTRMKTEIEQVANDMDVAWLPGLGVGGLRGASDATDR